MQFFQTIKTQHLSLLDGLPKGQIYRGLLGILSVVLIFSDVIVFLVFRDEIIRSMGSLLEIEAFEEAITPMFITAIAIFHLLFEYLWIALVAYVTMRILKYVQTPLQFKHLFNMYLLIRVYELLISLAVLLGTVAVVLVTGADVSGMEDTGGISTTIGAYIIPVLFFWLYISSVRYVRDRQDQKDKQTTPDV